MILTISFGYFLGFSSLAGAVVVTDDTTIAADKTFDYVVVGAGLAGITVSNKVLTPTISP